jgi:hypothetical protein
MVLQKRMFPLTSVLLLLMMIGAFRHTWPENMFLLPAVILVSLSASILNWVVLVRQADTVIDAGDGLIVTKGDQQVRIPLRDVTSVNPTLWGVTLQVSPSTSIGPTIRFSPQRALGRGAVIMSLRARIDAAKRA